MDPGLAEIVAPTLASLGTWSLRRAICDVRRTLAPRLHLSPPHMCGREPELVQQALARWGQVLTCKIHVSSPAPKGAVIVVHLYGQPADMDAIVESCARHEVPLIEAAAESLGATLRAALQTRTSG